MTEKKCKELIKKDVSEIAALCSELLCELDEINLNDIDSQLDKIAGKYGVAKKRLMDCEDY